MKEIELFNTAKSTLDHAADLLMINFHTKISNLQTELNDKKNLILKLQNLTEKLEMQVTELKKQLTASTKKETKVRKKRGGRPPGRPKKVKVETVDFEKNETEFFVKDNGATTSVEESFPEASH